MIETTSEQKLALQILSLAPFILVYKMFNWNFDFVAFIYKKIYLIKQNSFFLKKKQIIFLNDIITKKDLRLKTCRNTFIYFLFIYTSFQLLRWKVN